MCCIRLDRAAALSTAIAWIGAAPVLGGNLLPPAGPVAPSMKTLTQVEPRTLLNTLPTSPNYVHVISQSGSYYLGKDVQGVAGKGGILINASEVTIDLNGFAVRGVAGSLDGITTELSLLLERIVVRNGMVLGWDGKGISLRNSEMCAIESIRAFDNADDAIEVGNGAVITGCNARDNGGIGFDMFSNGVISHCVARANMGDGFSVSGTASVSHCTSLANNGYGFDLQDSCTMFACTSEANTLEQVRAVESNVIRTCAIQNANSAGILLTGNANSVIDCAFEGLTTYGLKAEGSGNLIRGNTFYNTDIGLWATGDRNRIDSNSAMAGTFGFDIDSTNNLIIRNSVSDNSIVGFGLASTTQAYGQLIFVNGPTGMDETYGPWINISH